MTAITEGVLDLFMDFSASDSPPGKYLYENKSTNGTIPNIIKKIDYPFGAVNLIFGQGTKVGSLLSKDKNINMISFTGSTAVGKKIMRTASKNIKRISLELGGKNSMIVLDDADIKKSLQIIIDSFTGNAGQSCVSISRLLVHKRIQSEIVSLLVKKLESIKKFRKIYGKISTNRQFKFIKDLIKKNKKYHKNIIYGDLNFKNKEFINPIIFLNLPEKNLLNSKEIFGPILCVRSFEKIEEAINISNSSKMGLSAIICTKNINKALEISKQLKSGRIWINESVKSNFPQIPIGGFKESGLNREAGEEGYRTYTEIKSIIIKK
jgi:acyl-CoA reductase-like NAD-dependent aldehyde dehydrogenase